MICSCAVCAFPVSGPWSPLPGRAGDSRCQCHCWCCSGTSHRLNTCLFTHSNHFKASCFSFSASRTREHSVCAASYSHQHLSVFRRVLSPRSQKWRMAVQVLGTIGGLFIVDRLGRRQILIISSCITFAAELALGIIFAVSVDSNTVELAHTPAVACIVLVG